MTWTRRENDFAANFQSRYTHWIQGSEPDTIELARQRTERFPWSPRISLLLTIPSTIPVFLDAFLASILAQTYSNWELCIVEGKNDVPSNSQFLQKTSHGEPRIRMGYHSPKSDVSWPLNAALTMSGGEFIALVDGTDLISPFALYEVVKAIQTNPATDFIYSDEDRLGPVGNNRNHPQFKPDWSPDNLRCLNYIGRLTVIRRALVDAVGGFRPEFNDSQEYDLVLRATEKANQIVHIPKILYHRRILVEPWPRVFEKIDPKPGTREKPLVEHLVRQNISGAVKKTNGAETYQIHRKLSGRPLVSIIIPNKDQVKVLRRCLKSVFKSKYCNYEIIIAENNSLKQETFEFYRLQIKRPEVRVITWNYPFNFAAICNFAAAQGRGQILLFLNNDVEAIEPDWIERLLEHALRPEVGIVGAKLYYPDGSLQHGGIIIDPDVIALEAHKNWPKKSNGYSERLIITQNLSAVTGACLMIRKTVFEAVKGFDERFALAFNDVDLCLKVRQQGWLVVWTPHSELYHYESKTRGPDNSLEKKERLLKEIEMFKAKWLNTIYNGDPYYNKNLHIRNGAFPFPDGNFFRPS